MLADPEPGLAGAAVDDQVGDPLGFFEVMVLTGGFIGRHQRLGQVHVGVLAAIARHRRPVGRKLLGDRPVLLLPEFGVEDLGDVGQHVLGQRMADQRRRRGGQQHEGVAIALLAGIDRARIVDLPVIAAMGGVAMGVPQEVHAVVDEIGRARPAEQMADRHAVDHARRRVDAAHGIAGIERLAIGVELEEAALRVDRAPLEIVEQAVGFGAQPVAMGGQALPGVSGHDGLLTKQVGAKRVRAKQVRRARPAGSRRGAPSRRRRRG
jgi:hypothetical protein